MSIKILGTGSYLPEKRITNDDLSKVMDTSDEWISSRTGIRARHISVKDTTCDMAVKAARIALEESKVAPEELDYIFLATVSPDCATPSTACLVQSELGAVNATCMDINAACSGFLFGLNTAMAYTKAKMAKKILVIGVETLSKLMDWNDRSTCVLFGDGAGCAVVEADESKDVIVDVGSDGSLGKVLMCEERPLKNFLVDNDESMSYVSMNGSEVFRFAVKKVPKTVQAVLDQGHIDKDDIKYFVLHQANQRIIESVARRLKVDLDKFPMNLDQCGNTSAASIPILLDQMNKEGMLERGDKIILCGFGGGLTWGAIYLEW
ncbi:MAG: ketoacyl-ACP synthase III [Anaerostipes sp.]|jgi:3-oxoacyl-[acyl-carrier-protein] synthase-3|nr:ketoacyl-ACP synthase III [Anaerostipes sp.]MDD3745283.1 ketoacyl-ACP synthase III [Anaerostipes sp.]